MGIANNLFHYAQDTEKQTLHRRITLSDEQLEEQTVLWNDLKEFIEEFLKEATGLPIRSWLQGSYKFKTQIRPVRIHEESDIDLGIYFLWSGAPEDGNYTPAQLRQLVQMAIEQYAAENPEDVLEVCPPKTRCCRIRYRNNFHIDVPVYHLDSAKDRRSLATDEGWEDSDPKKIYIWFKDEFPDDGERYKARRQIKYLKVWAGLTFPKEERPSSILLTVLVAEALKKLGSSTTNADDTTFRDIIHEIRDRLSKSSKVTNPVNEDENLARLSDNEMQNFIERLSKLLETASRACEQKTELDAASIWQGVFSHFFPLPESDGITESRNSLVPSYMPEISISATSRTNPYANLPTTYNQVGPIPRDCDLTFKLTNAHLLPANAQVVWFVRNEGREAEITNDLGHYAGTGLCVTEHTSYKGRHYMDCIIYLHDRPLAVRRVPVLISGTAVPARNISKTPTWRRFAKRR